jgi:hypothetical protein
MDHAAMLVRWPPIALALPRRAERPALSPAVRALLLMFEVLLAPFQEPLAVDAFS